MPEQQENRETYVRILQANVNRSATAQQALLSTAKPDLYDIIAIQEPYLDSNQLTRANPYWVVQYPTLYIEDQT